jgi:large subunit ribosomal protein L21
MFAVIKTGGKQYLVSPGDKIKIERLPSVEPEEGKEEKETQIIFDEVLLLEKDEKLEIGTPLVKGAKVEAKLLEEGKLKKVIIFKYKPKKRYKVKRGHRQLFSEVEILDIKK